MLKQEYSSKNLSKIIRHKHVFSWNMWHNNSEKNRILQEYADEINLNKYSRFQIPAMIWFELPVCGLL